VLVERADLEALNLPSDRAFHRHLSSREFCESSRLAFGFLDSSIEANTPMEPILAAAPKQGVCRIGLRMGETMKSRQPA
jgi:hypothetical protein